MTDPEPLVLTAELLDIARDGYLSAFADETSKRELLARFDAWVAARGL